MKQRNDPRREPDDSSSKRRILGVIAQITANQVIGWLVRHCWG